MKLTFLAVALICSMAVSSPRAPQITKQKHTYYGAAMTSCGQWITDRKESPHNLAGSWLLGWVSAAGIYSTPLRETNPAAILAWVDEYCMSKPSHDLLAAAINLVEELRLRGV